METEKHGIERTMELIEQAANQYVTETNNELPSLDNSDVTVTDDNTEIVILRDKGRNIIAHYQLLKDYKFFRIDSHTA